MFIMSAKLESQVSDSNTPTSVQILQGFVAGGTPSLIAHEKHHPEGIFTSYVQEFKFIVVELITFIIK
jgi:hypothetical protein